MRELSRREALRVVGAGAALLVLGAHRSLAAGEAVAGGPAEPAPAEAAASQPSANTRKAKVPAKQEEPPQPFVLPPLAYAFDALEPYLDARTMELHYASHHQGCIDDANLCLAEYPTLLKMTAEELLRDLRVAPPKIRGLLRYAVGGHANHSLYWSLLSPKPQRLPGKELATAIDVSFGSFDAFKLRFVETAMKRFGSGWAWLVLTRDGKLALYSTANNDSPLMEGLSPLIGVDVWEHAYYLKHFNVRLEYLNDFLQVLDWHRVDHGYAEALAARAKK